MGEANEEKTSVRNDLHTMDLNLYLDAREFDVHVQKNESHKVLSELEKQTLQTKSSFVEEYYRECFFSTMCKPSIEY